MKAQADTLWIHCWVVLIKLPAESATNKKFNKRCGQVTLVLYQIVTVCVFAQVFHPFKLLCCPLLQQHKVTHPRSKVINFEEVWGLSARRSQLVAEMKHLTALAEFTFSCDSSCLSSKLFPRCNEDARTFRVE